MVINIAEIMTQSHGLILPSLSLHFSIMLILPNKPAPYWCLSLSIIADNCHLLLKSKKLTYTTHQNTPGEQPISNRDFYKIFAEICINLWGFFYFLNLVQKMFTDTFCVFRLLCTKYMFIYIIHVILLCISICTYVFVCSVFPLIDMWFLGCQYWHISFVSINI